jgi:hypothetical protein
MRFLRRRTRKEGGQQPRGEEGSGKAAAKEGQRPALSVARVPVFISGEEFARKLDTALQWTIIDERTMTGELVLRVFEDGQVNFYYTNYIDMSDDEFDEFQRKVGGKGMEG